mmetsp:Transcript_26426/g.40051  ORF Transcript_26426/g.40051 Transcript_26426/m.40051 type:complete len:358 (-) Transcript_26426:203-1276(-)|eukprot:CAMPEP_0178910358 /NCGR_PEP_ID=MMETSP0786-20121207/9053_1 /TAXON_ID=186022 /ORGANISM="Thalassionema frauenfeldii, Strain CCMP 1798" /LENGTH=357 /DNA_ID=CAMNT_0020582601 /DNA_START=68 /DNA_END=1141 /DNA_ORIENTATION=-
MSIRECNFKMAPISLLLLAMLQQICQIGCDAAFDWTRPQDRRSVMVQSIGSIVTSMATTAIRPACASEGEQSGNDKIDELSLAQPLGPGDSSSSKPSAPVEYLLPAARVGVYIYQLVAITQDCCSKNDGSKQEQNSLQENIAKLDALVLSPPPFIRRDVDINVDVNRKSDPYGTSLPLVGEFGVALKKQKERQSNSIQVGFAPQFFEVGELVGERRQWNQLQTAERQREQSSEVRRAFNIYTTNLNFNRNRYEWKGSTEEKRQRIRSDKLPTTTDVIRSDLDTRDLYRNEVQTALEDAKAEYLYQKKQSGNDGDGLDFSELLEILMQAQLSIDKWFKFIPDRDVQAALELVKQEQKA